MPPQFEAYGSRQAMLQAPHETQHVVETRRCSNIPRTAPKTIAVCYGRDSGHNCEGAGYKLSSHGPEHNSAVNFASNVLRRGL